MLPRPLEGSSPARSHMIVHLRADDIFVIRQRHKNFFSGLEWPGSDDAGAAGADVREFDDVSHNNPGEEFFAVNPKRSKRRLTG